jgi:GntR family transcriptional regulator/MocR family aminotransferase
MTTLPSGLPVVVDRAARTPLAVQISAQLQAAVNGGALRAGDRLPSSRDLSATLGVSRTVVTNAYARLFAEGWLEGRHGSGTYVADVTPPSAEALGEATKPDQGPGRANGRGSAWADVPSTPERKRVSPRPFGAFGGSAAPTSLIDLQPGISWAEGIEPAIWSRAWRQAGAHLPSRWPDPHGLPELREEIAAYLRRSRGLAISPAHVLVTQGVSSGLALLADALLTPGDKAGIEEPGYATGREVLRRAGARVVPCRVDAHGIAPEELPCDLKLLYTTPAHQYPLGGRLPVNRRQALVAWARATGALVVEDDYDSEFRYAGRPLASLQGIDRGERVIYLGTFSKVIFPGLRLGYAVVPHELLDAMIAARYLADRHPPGLAESVLTEFIEQGHFGAHLRRMCARYRGARDTLVAAIGAKLGAYLEVVAPDQGMHLTARLRPGLDDAAVARAAAARGVVVRPLSALYVAAPPVPGLMLGFTGYDTPSLIAGVDRLAWVLRDMAG